MAYSTPLVSDDGLTISTGSQKHLISLDSTAWWRWLAATETTTFHFKNDRGSFTARRERKHGKWYWYAYRKQHGKLHKAYLGKTEELALERLNMVALHLNEQTAEAPAEQPIVSPQANLPSIVPSPPQQATNLPELQANDLRFTIDEVATFLQQMMAPNLSLGEIKELDAHTEGWVAGLQLAALSLQGQHNVQQFLATFNGSHRDIIEYLIRTCIHTLLDAAGETGTLPTSENILSKRETAVLQLIAAGKSNQEIAQELVVALSTVKTHLNNLYSKLGVHSRTQAIARAKELQLLQ
jgi:DNA-binding CsgD family transcriptional regulator